MTVIFFLNSTPKDRHSHAKGTYCPDQEWTTLERWFPYRTEMVYLPLWTICVPFLTINTTYLYLGVQLWHNKNVQSKNEVCRWCANHYVFIHFSYEAQTSLKLRRGLKHTCECLKQQWLYLRCISRPRILAERHYLLIHFILFGLEFMRQVPSFCTQLLLKKKKRNVNANHRKLWTIRHCFPPPMLLTLRFIM